MAVTGGVRVSAHVPVVASTQAKRALLGSALARDMVVPLWEGLTLIPGRGDHLRPKRPGKLLSLP